MFVGAIGDRSISKGINGSMDNLSNAMFFTHGAVYHYVFDAGNWGFATYLKGSNQSGSNDLGFGYDIAISNDARVIAIGEPGDSSDATGVDANRGRVLPNSMYLLRQF